MEHRHRVIYCSLLKTGMMKETQDFATPLLSMRGRGTLQHRQKPLTSPSPGRGEGKERTRQNQPYSLRRLMCGALQRMMHEKIADGKVVQIPLQKSPDSVAG